MILRSAANLLQKSSVLILGGGGLVGSAIAKHLGRLPSSMRPSRVIVAALTKDGAMQAVQDLVEQRKPSSSSYSSTLNDHDDATEYIPAWGDVFVRKDLANVPPRDRKADPTMRTMMLNDTLGDFKPAFENNHLVSMVREFKPNVIVDCINTATVLSYQDVFTASIRLRQAITVSGRELPPVTRDMHQSLQKAMLAEESEQVILSLTTPPLIRHVRCLSEVAREQHVQGYLKIGTTGTGGMGLNIPYTHSEDRPSQCLLAKTTAAFGHSGLLLLWSLTPGAPFVKELKPAAAIGYKGMDIREVADKHGNSSLYGGRIVELKESESLALREDPASYTKLGPMRMAVVDLGENGCFTSEEFKTITSPGQMELISPEEISEKAVEELLSVSTGHNILAAMRGTLLGPGYRAGINRTMACEQLDQLCDDTSMPFNRSLALGEVREVATAGSVALGKLGPPTLSKLLFEARILANQCRTWEKLEDCDSHKLSKRLASMARKVGQSDSPALVDTTENLLSTAISVGVPVLFSDNHLLRGPNISTPEPKGMKTNLALKSALEIDELADRGWVDLRVPNLERWKDRARCIREQQESEGDSSYYPQGDWRLYNSTKGQRIDPPSVVAWILAVEQGGHRDIA